MAIFLAEARFKANGGGFFAGANDRPSQSPGDPSALLQPPRLEEAREVDPQLSAALPISRFRSPPCRCAPSGFSEILCKVAR
jgi:hypothetical protein